jgi:NodT family efflux transporter outer membrane factor (OMF) lipoprotein
MEVGVRRLLLIAASCLIAGGCGLSQWAHNGLRVGPNYHRPAAAVAEDWIDSNDQRVLSVPPDYYDWWSVFQDLVVNQLVETAYGQNLTLRQAGTRVMQARASRAIAAGSLFPQVQQSFGDYTRIQESKTIALPPPIRAFDQWDVGFNATWEIDVWGRFRRSLESADAGLEASVKEYDAILVSLIAEVVTAYVDIRTFQERLNYAQQNVEVQQSSLELSTNRFDEGKTSQVGVFLADANLNGTESTIPGLKVGLRQASNRLCILLGIPPTDLSQWIGEGSGIPTVPAEIAVGIPADLLRRRPDVEQAERLVATQSAQVGVAVSDLYPSISIVGEISQASEDFGDLLRSSSSAGLVGPGVRWNILNYGRIRNNIRLQDAGLLELIAGYQNTVLQANQEAEDALVAFLESQREVESLRANVDDLQRSLDLLLIQFEEGSINFSPIFVLQGSLRGAQDRLAAAQGQVLLNMIAVYRALGGGWQIRCGGYPTRPLPPLEPLPSPADQMLTGDEGEVEYLPLLPEPPLANNADD